MSEAGVLNVNLLSDVEKRALKAEYVRRTRERSQRISEYQPTERELSLADALEAKWFDKQRAFFTSSAKRRVAFCSRRAGKTIGVAIWFLASLLRNPTSLHLYMAQTASIAKLYLWPTMKRLIHEYDLPFKANETDLTIQHERGLGVIVSRGADKADEIEKLRGPKFKKIALDEAASFGEFFETLITQVLGATLRDESGELIMLGTAGRKKSGLFYEACHGLRRKKSDGSPVYELHKWTLQDNPYLSADAKDLDMIIDDEGFSGYDDDRFIREYLGVWAVGTASRVFSGFAPGQNTYEGSLPSKHEFFYIAGVDFGWHDESTIVVSAWSRTTPRIYMVDMWSAARQYTDNVAAVIKEFQRTYKLQRIVGDTGGYGKNVAVHLQRDYQITIEPAQKREKYDHIAFMNSAFARKDIQVHAKNCKGLIEQFQEVSWNESRTDSGLHEKDDRVHAALYSWRAAKSMGAGRETISTAPTEDPGRAFALKEKLAVLSTKPKDKSYDWISQLSGDHRPPLRSFGQRGKAPGNW